VTGTLPIVVDNTDPANPIVGISAAAIGSTILRANKNMVALVTVADGDPATATVVAATPAASTLAGGYVGVNLNGAVQVVGDGTKVGVPFYFSGDAGATARLMKAIVAGDTLHFNGTVAGFQLDVVDRLDLTFGVNS